VVPDSIGLALSITQLVKPASTKLGMGLLTSWIYPIRGIVFLLTTPQLLQLVLKFLGEKQIYAQHADSFSNTQFITLRCFCQLVSSDTDRLGYGIELREEGGCTLRDQVTGYTLTCQLPASDGCEQAP
jgi:hypothetical protein